MLHFDGFNPFLALAKSRPDSFLEFAFAGVVLGGSGVILGSSFSKDQELDGFSLRFNSPVDGFGRKLEKLNRTDVPHLPI